MRKLVMGLLVVKVAWS